MTSLARTFLLATTFATVFPTFTLAQETDTNAWRVLRAGTVVLLRHATAPGVGDPTNFKLGDCATQRNLDAKGRAEAKAIGDAFRAHGIVVGRVLSS